MEDLLKVGVITSTHGIRGEVKVFPTTDDAKRFKKLKNVILDNGKEKIDMEIASVKFFKNMVILKFKGIDDINDVEKYYLATRTLTSDNSIYQVLEDGKIYIGNLKEEMKIRPTLHVKPDLKIVSGSGTKDDPYKLG